MAVKIGEGTSEMTGDVKKTEDMKFSLKVNYSDKMKEITFKPLEDLKKGDKVKITVEKI
jgi:ribosomal protein L21E